ncbi:MAG TPA: nuclear transport factor 2 family protein [Thermoanaerobaculia bacterium]|nr:nuclear transport factor 2 family protein [Thermoanaerobaculia bacterium]
MLRPALAVLVLLALSCATTTPANNERIVQSIYDSFARGDAPAVLATFDPDIVWYEAENILYADRNPYRGPEAVAEGVFGRLMADFENFRVRVDETISEDDTVVVLGRYSATWKATNRPIDAQFVHVWKLRDGKVTNFQQYTDTAQFARAQSRP